MIRETKQSLAECIFYWSCQKSFTKIQTQTLISWISKNIAAVNSADSQDSAGLDSCRLDGASLAILMSLLYAIDVSVLETREEGL